jgi:hypothetical protein
VDLLTKKWLVVALVEHFCLVIDFIQLFSPFRLDVSLTNAISVSFV